MFFIDSIDLPKHVKFRKVKTEKRNRETSGSLPYHNQLFILMINIITDIKNINSIDIIKIVLIIYEIIKKALLFII